MQLNAGNSEGSFQEGGVQSIRLAVSCLPCLLGKTRESLDKRDWRGSRNRVGCSDLEPRDEGLLCHAECLYKNSEFLQSPVTATEPLSALLQSGTLRALSGIQRARQPKDIRRLAR